MGPCHEHAIKSRSRDRRRAPGDHPRRQGAQIEFETPRGTHRRAIYTFNGRSRFDVISTSPSSGGVLKAVRRHACTISPGGWFARSARRPGSARLQRCSS